MSAIVVGYTVIGGRLVGKASAIFTYRGIRVAARRHPGFARELRPMSRSSVAQAKHAENALAAVREQQHDHGRDVEHEGGHPSPPGPGDRAVALGAWWPTRSSRKERL